MAIDEGTVPTSTKAQALPMLEEIRIHLRCVNELRAQLAELGLHLCYVTFVDKKGAVKLGVNMVLSDPAGGAG